MQTHATRYEREFNATLAAAPVAKDVPAAKAAVGPVKLLYDTRQQYENMVGEPCQPDGSSCALPCFPTEENNSIGWQEGMAAGSGSWHGDGDTPRARPLATYQLLHTAPEHLHGTWANVTRHRDLCALSTCPTFTVHASAAAPVAGPPEPDVVRCLVSGLKSP